MSDLITIDGRQGEGGGQVLRTALGLAMYRGVPVRVTGVRGGRVKPGLMRQHLACVRAACLLTGGRAEGDEMGSTEVTFEPGGRVAGGEHLVEIGSAGSTTLVVQTVLPALLTAASCGGPVRLTVTGGTHNPAAPPAPFLADCFLPVLRSMGADVTLRTEAVGFAPRGGGRVVLDVSPVQTLRPLELTELGEAGEPVAEVLIGSLPHDIVEREIAALKKSLHRWPDEAFRVTQLDAEVGPANAVVVRLPFTNHTHVVVSLGARGRSAAAVANDAASQVRRYLKHKLPVGPHLADQLLIPLALAGGRFRALPHRQPDRHGETNLAVIEQMTGVRITRRDHGDGLSFFTG